MKKALWGFMGLMAVAAVAYAADVTLNWTPPQVTATQGAPTGYKVFKGQGAAVCSAPGPLSGTGTSFGSNVTTTTDTNLAEGQTYCYEASAFNSGGESPRSNRVTKVIPVNPPGAPVLSIN